MEGYLNILQNRIQDLVQISIKERKQNGLGVLFLDFTKKEELNCFFLKIDDQHFPPDLKQTILDRFNNSPKSIIYFNVFDEKLSEIVEIDLDKNSNYHEHLKPQSKLEPVIEEETNEDVSTEDVSTEDVSNEDVLN